MGKKSKEPNDIEKLKEEYEKLSKKYSLPDYKKLNELFDIEEVNPETDFLLRIIRRKIIEKISNYFRFIEIILNPSMAPLFLHKKLKNIHSEERALLSRIYEQIGNLEAETILLDLEYSEKAEAEFIKKLFHTFNNTIKNDLIKSIKNLINETNGENREIKGSYLG